MVHGLYWFRPVLDCGCVGDLERVGLTMSIQEQQSATTPSQHDNEHAQESIPEYGKNIPGAWQLSPQQRAFIELFDEDEE
jgi:hypothetical protein